MPKVLVIGAHPDDCEIKAGGTALLWSRAGFEVTFVSVTDGSAGHQSMPSEPLAERRRKEAAAAGEILGVRSRVLEFVDGNLFPSLAARDVLIRLIREIAPDLVLTHRPNDYHPDHRYTSQLVQDASYLVTVPRIAEDTRALARKPVIGYLSDHFQKPIPFAPDVIVPTDAVVEEVVRSLAAHESQFFEWLPFNMGILDNVPTDPAEREARLRDWYVGGFATKASGWPGRVPDARVDVVEAFEISEYGAPLTAELRTLLFPFTNY